MKRLKDAEACISGASNPRRIAVALVEAIDECRVGKIDDVALRDDAGIVLILDQLMNVLDAYSGTKPARFTKAYQTLLDAQSEETTLPATTGEKT